MIGVFRGCRIAANAIAAVAIVLLLVDPTRDLAPICLLLAVAMTCGRCAHVLLFDAAMIGVGRRA
jgi:hypothetical protein